MTVEFKIHEMTALAEKFITKPPFDNSRIEKIIDVLSPHERCNNSVEYYLDILKQMYAKNTGEPYISAIPCHIQTTY